MIIVFATVDTAEQEVGRAECIEAIGDDYANGAVGREIQVLMTYEHNLSRQKTVNLKPICIKTSTRPALTLFTQYNRTFIFVDGFDSIAC